MNALELLTVLSDRNVQLWIENEQLRYRAPKGILKPELRDALLKHKDEVISLLRQRARESVFSYPLSYAQKALWFINQAIPESTSYNASFSARIRSRVDFAALKRVFQVLMDRHPVLRTTYSDNDGEPVQRVHGYMKVSFSETDGSLWSEEELKEQAIEAHRRPFDLKHGPLLRVHVFTRSERDHVFLMVAHHIVLDGWSLWLLLDEIRSLYSSELNGKPPSIPAPEAEYTDYVRWQAQLLAGNEGERLWTYWKKQLGGELARLNLSGHRSRRPVQRIEGASHIFAIEEHLTGQIKSLARAEGVTLFTLLLTLYQLLLHRYTGQEDILVSSPVAGRSRPEFERIVGCFINPVVFRGRVSKGITFRQALKETEQMVLEALEHQDYPFALLTQRLLLGGDLSSSPLFQVDFVLQKPQQSEDISSIFGTGMEVSRINFGGLELEPFYIPQQEGQLDLTLEMAEGRGLLWGILKYNTDLFDAPAIERMAGHFRMLLKSVLADPAERIEALPMLTDAERNQLLAEWSQTKSDYVGARSKSSFCVHQIFEFEAERLPNTVAVVFDGEEITYRELNEQANRLAHFLKKNGVNQETLVGIYMERSLGLIVALLGVLKAGGAYLPLDPMYPQERLAFMLDDSGAQVVLTHGFLAKNLSPCRAQVVCLDSVQDTINREDNGNPLPVATPNNLVYAIYTSGSTGQAKGVMVEHRSLANAYLFWDETYQLHTLKSHLQMASFSFDVFTGDLVRALCSGGKLVLCPREYLMDPPNLYRLMRREKVDFAEFVPAVLRELVSYLHKDGSKLDFLKILVCGSDSWNMDEYRRFKEVCGPNTRLINSYGVTEATIDSTYFEGTSKDFSCDVLVPIGRPFANIELYVLDSNLQPTPIGVPGELHIGGVGLARGYLNRPELTAEKFITNPFGDRPKQRLYKTGDLARYLPDANIELLGRVDFQVKIRGFRVETGEIESVLGQHPGVEQIAVAALDDALGNKRLVGYVVVKDSQSAPSMNDLRSFLKKKLPEYMVPSTFLLMDKLPLTPNGKIDRRALPTPDSLDSELEVSYVAPRSETEKKLGAIWQEVLNRDKVGVHHDFFELGGHSLLATRVMSRINQLFGIQLALRKLFEVTTIASLADLVDTLLWTGKQTFGTLPPEEREIIEM